MVYHEESNSTCPICIKRFNENNEPILLYECGHLVHSLCFGIKKKNCSICKLDMDPFDPSKIILSDKISKQKQIDVNSMRKSTWKPNLINYFKLIYRIPMFIKCYFQLIINYYLITLSEKMIGNLSNNINYWEKYKKNTVKNFFTNINKIFNINVNFKGLDKINPMQKKIFISNHVSYYDIFAIASEINCGVVLSSSANNFLIKTLTKLIPCLIIDRGIKNNTVKLIENFVNTNNVIFICPQGIFSHYQTISKFRSGAFATKYPVQPIILKYKQDISSMSMFYMLLNDRVDVNIEIMNVIPNIKNLSPKEYSEFVLDQIIIKSNLIKSNISSIDVIDKK